MVPGRKGQEEMSLLNLVPETCSDLNNAFMHNFIAFSSSLAHSTNSPNPVFRNHLSNKLSESKFLYQVLLSLETKERQT